MEKFDGEKFIRTVLIRDIQGLIDKDFDYFAFVIIGQGIEMLGSFFDDKPFDYYEPRLPLKRFKKGLTLMDTKYQEMENILWENLRCGLAHQLKPKRDIYLTSYKSGGNDSINTYRGDKSGYIYFVVDSLFKDFKIACEKVIDKLKDPANSEIPPDKRKEIHLTVIQTNFKIDGARKMIIE